MSSSSDRDTFRAQLAELDLSHRPVEEPFRQRMLDLIDSTPDCFLRTAFPAHFTGGAFVVSADGRRALLNHHRKLNKWIAFGGHCDGDANVLRVAQREALEETGIEGLIVASHRPFDLDIHAIPALKDEPPHEHFDVRYVLIAPEGADYTVSEESHALAWVTPDEADALELDDSMRRLVAKWRALLKRRGVH